MEALEEQIFATGRYDALLYRVFKADEDDIVHDLVGNQSTCSA